MPSQILAKYGTIIKPTFSFGGIINANGRICTQIDNSAVRATYGMLGLRLRVGTTPTANQTFRVYLHRYTGDLTNNIGDGVFSGAPSADNLGVVDATLTTEPTNAPLVGVIGVTNVAVRDYTLLAPVYDPGIAFAFSVWNATGATSDGTNANHLMQWFPMTEEAQ